MLTIEQQPLTVGDDLLVRLDEELSGAHEYIELAQEEPDPVEVRCLLAIAQDEYQHAEFIMAMIEESGQRIPPNSEAYAKEIKAMLGKFRKF